MAYPVYSERFMHHQAQGYWYWYVPTGRRAVVKAFTVVNLGQATSFAFVRIGTVVAAIASFQAVNQTLNVVTHHVAYGGEYFELYNSHDGVNSTLSGHLLDDPGEATGPPASAHPLPSPPGSPLPGSPPLILGEQPVQLRQDERGADAGGETQLELVPGMQYLELHHQRREALLSLGLALD